MRPLLLATSLLVSVPSLAASLDSGSLGINAPTVSATDTTARTAASAAVTAAQNAASTASTAATQAAQALAAAQAAQAAAAAGGAGTDQTARDAAAAAAAQAATALSAATTASTTATTAATTASGIAATANTASTTATTAASSLDALAGVMGFKPSSPIVYLPRGQGGPGYPSNPIPACASAKPTNWPTSDLSNLTNVAWWVFGSGYAPATSPGCQSSWITNRTQLDQNFEHNQINGNANTNIDGGAKDVNPGIFNGFLRTYPEGDVHDNLLVKGDGLHFKAGCLGVSGGYITSCQGYGGVEASYVRPELQVPEGGVVLEACYTIPDDPTAWFTNWLYEGAYPPPQSTDYTLFYNDSQIYPTTMPGRSNEIDIRDGYPFAEGTPINHTITSVLPSPLRADQNKSMMFSAVSGGFGPKNGAAPGTEEMVTTVDLSAMPHCWQMEKIAPVWNNANRDTLLHHGHIVNSLDGVEYQDQQFDANNAPISGITSNGVTGGLERKWNGQPTGRSGMPQAWMIGLQMAPNFNATAPNSLMTPASVARIDAKLVSMGMWTRTPGTVHQAPTLVNGVTPTGEQTVFPPPTFPIDLTSSIPINVLFARSSQAEAAGSNGALILANRGIPRFANGGGLMLEAAGSNVASLQVSSGLNASTGAVGRDGLTANANYVQDTSNGQRAIKVLYPAASGTTYVFNADLGPIGSNAGSLSITNSYSYNDNLGVAVNLTNCTITGTNSNTTNVSATMLGGSCHLTFTWTNGGNALGGFFMIYETDSSGALLSYTGDGVSGFSVAFAQAETPAGTSPIPPSGRATEQLQFTVPAGKTGLTLTFADNSTQAITGLTGGTVWTSPATGFAKSVKTISATP